MLRAAALCFLLLAAALPALAQQFPALSGRVVDQAGILGPETEAAIADQLAAHEQATSNQVVVATIASLEGHDIADYGYRLGRHWGIGQEGRNNGVLLIVAPEERKVRIEVGYGLEGNLPDATAKLIIENEILPQFRSGNMPGGIRAGVTAILAAIDGAYEPVAYSDDPGPEDSFLTFLPVLLFFVFIVLARSFSRRDGAVGRRRRRRGILLGGSAGGFAGGFGGGGSSGGGGFSGGGGGFGGGGASGGW
ncbi:MAG: TPM domain-containing protein [Minwuia sp.]|uniref:TPM domain-containing protein n=1 Tax=Minwuia sp. TaxID=2493630 RepID=UPI003A83C64F